MVFLDQNFGLLGKHSNDDIGRELKPPFIAEIE